MDQNDYTFITSKPTGMEYSVYLEDEIVGGFNYKELCQALAGATENDIFNFYIGGYGGSCNGLMHVVNSIRSTKAKETNMILVAPSFSAHATLALVGTSLRYEPFTFLMFHNYSGAAMGKGGEIETSHEATKRWIGTYMRSLHAPFLSPKECAHLELDRDVYVHFDDPDLPARLKRHFSKKPATAPRAKKVKEVLTHDTDHSA